MEVPKKIVEVKLVKNEDKELWMPLWLGYQEFYKMTVPSETTDITWGRFLDSTEPINAALAWYEGKVVGFAHYVYHRSSSTIGHYCYLQDLFVDSTIRGQGIGKQLIEYVYATANAAGCTRVHWLTHETNTTAQKLYNSISNRSGFIQYRTVLPNK
eukprot:gene7395-9087_t